MATATVRYREDDADDMAGALDTIIADLRRHAEAETERASAAEERAADAERERDALREQVEKLEAEIAEMRERAA